MRLIGINTCKSCLKVGAPASFEFLGTQKQCILYLEGKKQKFKTSLDHTVIEIDGNEIVGFEGAISYIQRRKG